MRVNTLNNGNNGTTIKEWWFGFFVWKSGPGLEVTLSPCSCNWGMITWVSFHILLYPPWACSLTRRSMHPGLRSAGRVPSPLLCICWGSSPSDQAHRRLWPWCWFSSVRFWVVRVFFRCVSFELCSHFAVLGWRSGVAHFLSGTSGSIFWVTWHRCSFFAAELAHNFTSVLYYSTLLSMYW